MHIYLSLVSSESTSNVSKLRSEVTFSKNVIKTNIQYKVLLLRSHTGEGRGTSYILGAKTFRVSVRMDKN